MTVSMIEIVNDKQESVSFYLDDPSQPYFVKDVQGLDPVKADITSSSFAAVDGNQFQASRRDSRNIIFKLGYNPDYVSNMTIPQLRRNLYSKFLPKSLVQLKIHLDDDLVVGNTGIIESFDAPIFTKSPDITISVILFDPDLISDTDTVLNGNTTDNPTTGKINFTYEGNTPTGVNLTMVLNRAADSITFLHYNLVTNNLESMYLYGTFLSGDELVIATGVGEKGVWLTRSGDTESILYMLDVNSQWIYLTPGLTAFQVIVTGPAIPYTITYRDRYGGL